MMKRDEPSAKAEGPPIHIPGEEPVDLTHAPVAEGFYRDPQDPTRERWWDGFVWRDQTRLAEAADDAEDHEAKPHPSLEGEAWLADHPQETTPPPPPPAVEKKRPIETAATGTGFLLGIPFPVGRLLRRRKP